MPAAKESANEQRSQEFSLYGAALGDVDAALSAASSLPRGAMIVKRIDAGSPADRAGLMPGDIIVRVDGQSLSQESASALMTRSGDCLVGLANGGSVLIRRGS